MFSYMIKLLVSSFMVAIIWLFKILFTKVLISTYHFNTIFLKKSKIQSLFLTLIVSKGTASNFMWASKNIKNKNMYLFNKKGLKVYLKDYDIWICTLHHKTKPEQSKGIFEKSTCMSFSSSLLSRLA